MRIVEKRRREVKEKMREIKEAEGFETRITLIQALIPLGLEQLSKDLQEEVAVLAGARYSRQGGVTGVSRWGKQRGSVYMQDVKVPVTVPRIRDTITGAEVPLQTYKRLQKQYRGDEKLMKRVLSGLSCRNYEDCVEAVPGVFGLKPTTVSRRYIRASAKKLKELMERRLEGYDIVAMFVDGKTFADDEIVMALGVTIDGKKVILGMVQTGTENERVLSRFFEEFKDRGLDYSNGILFVIDGAKGFVKAVKKSFGEYAEIHRCHWHKRENVVSYLPKGKKDEYRRKLQAAYEKPTYDEAKEELKKIRSDLKCLNESAAGSLDEGFEETLTLHRLGLFRELGISFKTTNCIESVMSMVERKTNRVTYWKNSSQKMRWVATSLLDIEPRLRTVKGYKHLPMLRAALQSKIKQNLGASEVA